ncbi:hypothetical protein K491DRAFT_592135 [Lophiostoma macrostomum CBS 122681]|uniref:ER transporter 6TM N-terminal domain-containing protein n=1 Tax=Lophiostoma macrostomum CBS 122681 TaxID=1314788 RepID=A0A6A6TI70_9PLEO|nr:hypothetical protein K491DRAFT_592135 [Lophiostoma macrostomum CBS 122681]
MKYSIVTRTGIVALLIYIRAALPPTIALAMYQSHKVAAVYSTLGYLVAIISILGFCIMPRAKFLQTMTMNIIGICLGAAVQMLALWSGVQARIHTTRPGTSPRLYNSSQSAVMGIWLFFQIYLINSMKAKFPQLAFPTIMYAIFANVACIYGPQFPTTAAAESFLRRLLIAFLTGLALATGVSLFIIPVTCRKIVGKQMTGYIGALRGALQAHKTYFQSLETTDMFTQFDGTDADESDQKKKPKQKPEVAAVKKLTETFVGLHGKLHGDLPFAKRELAYGKLTPDDLEAIFKHLRDIMIPLMGLGSMIDLFERTAEKHHWTDPDVEINDPEAEASRQKAVHAWNEVMTLIHEPLSAVIQAMDGGLEHILLKLQFVKPPKREQTKVDEEAKGDLIRPGDDGFVAHLEAQVHEFYHDKETTLSKWMESKGIKVSAVDEPQTPLEDMSKLEKQSTTIRSANQSQLYAILYVVYLLHCVSLAILKFVKFADEKDQAKAKSKLISPGKKRLKKWIVATFKAQDSNEADETTAPGLDRDSSTVYMGEAYKSKKDPEHLPPTTAWEKFGNAVRTVPGFLRSPESAFGFRAACATMSVAIVAYLKDTQVFFVQQRLVWAMIMVAISMTPTAGQSVFAFLLRIIGTLGAMLVSWLVWYIPDQKTPGIIVFLFVFLTIVFYIPLKRMDLVIVGLISVVTATMIVGYELEVRVLGVQVAESNGQPAYPIYELAPYRLATVTGGLAVAFIWTFFPYPISEHSALRQKLGGALYLSANFYSIVHETVMARVRGDEGDVEDTASPGYQLTKARNKVFAKQMLLLQSLKMHSSFVRWEFPLGGKFPQKEYDAIIQYVQNITNYTALLSYASSTFTQSHLTDEADPSHEQWFRDFRRILKSANITSHEITSMLSLLSSSITNGQPLPPYLRVPEAYQLSKRMAAIDRDVLSPRHIAEPGYAAFAVLQISTSCINMDVEKLLSAVKKLVGELDFSFHVVSTQASSSTSSSQTLVKTTSGRSKQD